MAIRERMLGQLRPANTTAATLYTRATAKHVVCKGVIVSNSTGGAVLCRVFVDDDGTTYDETTQIAWDKSVPANDFIIVGGAFMGMSTVGGTIGVRTATADALTFTAFGAEID